MAVTAKWYGLALKGQYSTTATNRVDWVTDTIKVALTTSAYTPNQDTHDFFDDITNEVVGTGYTAGGASLANKVTPIYDTASNEMRLDADDAVWATSSLTARYAILYKSTGTASTSPLLGYVDFGGDQTTSAADFTIQWDATGVLKITAL